MRTFVPGVSTYIRDKKPVTYEIRRKEVSGEWATWFCSADEEEALNRQGEPGDHIFRCGGAIKTHIPLWKWLLDAKTYKGDKVTGWVTHDSNHPCPLCGQIECRQCAVCGEPKCAHDEHEFKPVCAPVACVCDPMEWGDPSRIPGVCDSFDGVTGGQCEKCEHSYECHQ